MLKGYLNYGYEVPEITINKPKTNETNTVLSNSVPNKRVFKPVLPDKEQEQWNFE